jgi:tetratricopeptide (TPR) repeat protein
MRLTNLAYAQFHLNLVDEAIASVRVALRLDAGYPQVHLVLGSILAGSRHTLPEAIPHLERAAEAIPSARPALERAQRELQLAAR